MPFYLHTTFASNNPKKQSRLGLRQESGNGSRRTTQSRLLCFVVTAIAKLATYHRELLPRARVALGKVRGDISESH